MRSAEVGSTGKIILDAGEMESMLVGGARWALSQGYGEGADLERIEACAKPSSLVRESEDEALRDAHV